MRTITDEQRRVRLARRQLLLPSERTRSITDIAGALVALHSTDPVTVYLSIAARSNNLTVTDVERALYDDRCVIRHHAMRRTLWVTTPTVAELAHAACTRKIAAVERRKSADFVADAAWFDEAVQQVVEFVGDAPLSTRAIGDALPDLKREIVYGAGTRNEATGSAHTRAVLLAAFDGALIRGRPAGTWIGSQYAWVASRAWSRVDWGRHDQLAGMTGLVRAWLERFGPGTLADIVWWTGSTKTLVRQALATLDVEPVQLSSGEGIGLSDDLDDLGPGGAWVAVLPALDPTPMGWKQRSWYLDDETTTRVVDRYGNIGPTVWADGRIVGGWVQRPDGALAIELTRAVTDDHRSMIDVEIARLRSFIGETRFKVRFPSPNQSTLLAGA